MPKSMRGYFRQVGAYGKYNPPQGREEMKYLDIVKKLSLNIPAGGTILYDTINVIAQGTGASQRIGRQATIRKLLCNYQVILPASIITLADVVRIIIYVDKQANGAAATPGQILKGSPPDIMSFKNLDNSKRFYTLLDKKIPISHRAGVGVVGEEFAQVIKRFSFFKNVNIPVIYDSTAGAITEIRSNNIGVLAISEIARITLATQFRLRYYG